ncbi:hypothetical protein G4O51_01280 [Candidatus Bathyarchaeota archaeon A05DMB-2]|jgi:hypothetical protein|nr:hypothetical protein [Candidatus Bathyarchaeota archaeon A05DMB-2]
MWLIMLAFAATIATAIWYTQAENDKYLLKYLSLIFWGTTIMVLVDHVVPFLMEGGGEFFEVSTEAAVLSGIMVVVGLAVWEGALLLKDPKHIIFKRNRP